MEMRRARASAACGVTMHMMCARRAAPLPLRAATPPHAMTQHARACMAHVHAKCLSCSAMPFLFCFAQKRPKMSQRARVRRWRTSRQRAVRARAVRLSFLRAGTRENAKAKRGGATDDGAQSAAPRRRLRYATPLSPVLFCLFSFSFLLSFAFTTVALPTTLMRQRC